MIFKIDRKSIRKNPDAGRTEFRRLTGVDSILALYKEQNDDANLFLFQVSNDYNHSEWHYYVKDCDKLDLQKYKDDNSLVTFEQNARYEIIKTLATQPDYLYEYHKANCFYCGELVAQSEFIYTPDEDMSQCPYCIKMINDVDYEIFTKDMIDEY